MAVYTLFGQPASPATLVSDTSNYTMGVQFSVSQPVTLTAIWFYSAPGAGGVPDDIALYQVSGTSLVASQSATGLWSGAAGSGWVRCAWTSPPSLTASTQYKGCIFDNDTVNFYSATSNYWSSGAGAGGITNGPLSAPNNAGSAVGQDTFTNLSSLAYPATAFNAANYWVDVEITASGPAPSVPPVLYSMRSFP